MASNVINIREFVNVSTGVAAAQPLVGRDWSAVLFVMKGTDEQATVIKKYDNLAAVIEDGSNTEAAKFATTLYGTSYNSVSVTAPIYVATIGMASTEEFTTNFTKLLDSQDYYYIAVDNTAGDILKKVAATLVNANQTNASHVLILDDYNAAAFNKDLETDLADGSSCSVLAYCASNKFERTMVVVENPSATNKYYSAAAIAYYSTRVYARTNRQMATLAFKPATGIERIDTSDPLITVSTNDMWHNLDEKHANMYLDPAERMDSWQRGNASNGTDLVDYIAADYLNYTVTISIYQLLRSIPVLPMNQDGANLLANVLDQAYGTLYQSGIIGPGVSQDGQTFGGKGYKYNIPLPTGVQKSNGLWDGITTEALLIGSTKRVVVINFLNQ